MHETDRDLHQLFDQTGAELDEQAWARLGDDDPQADAALAAQFQATATPLDQLTERRLLAPYLGTAKAPRRYRRAWFGVAAVAALALWIVRPTPQPSDSKVEPAPVTAAAQVEPATLAAEAEALAEFGPELDDGEVQVADNAGDPADLLGLDGDLDQGLDALHGLEGAPVLAMP